MTGAEIIGIVAALIIVGLVAGVVATLVAGLVLRDMIQDAVTNAMSSPDYGSVRLDDVRLTVNMKNSDDNVIWQTQISATGNELTSAWIERWLEKHDLVAMPKGVDFAVPPGVRR